MSEAPTGSQQPATDSPHARPERSSWPFWVTLFGLLVFTGLIILPRFLAARTTSCSNACIANLKQIDGGVQQWALENKKTATDIPMVSEVVLYLKGNQLPTCPQGGTYQIHTVSENPTCNIQGHSL